MKELFSTPAIFTDGIRVFLNTLTKKVDANCKITFFFCSGIINLLFDGLAYNTSGHFAHCSKNVAIFIQAKTKFMEKSGRKISLTSLTQMKLADAMK